MKLPDDKPLSDALKQWRVSGNASPRFREDVWKRIALEESQPALTAADLWKAWLARTFARPAFATAYVTALLAAGLTAGYLHGRAQQHRADTELA
ncbi:MAG: hypothetical protein ACRD5L_15830, partial [Bryobacteraceae bacterium]